MTTASVLELDHLSRRYGQRLVVNDVSLQVTAGEVFGFLGPNGAGKTTTIAMLLHLVRPTAGRALIAGYDVWRQPRQALAHVGALIETPALYPYLSGRDNLRVLARRGGLSDRRVDAVLETVGLQPHARVNVKRYSQGMRQRLALAAALLHEPSLLVLDEPANALDPAGMVELRQTLRSLAAQGRTVFLSSHLLHEVEQLCDRVAVLNQGRIVAQGRVADLLGAPGLILRVARSDVPVQALLLNGLGMSARPQPDGSWWLPATPEQAGSISTFLAQCGVAVAELRPQTRSLEAVFLALTDTAAPSAPPSLRPLEAHG